MTNAVIVGGGIVGTSVALALRDAGFEVLLLEKSVIGAESSDAAAGMLAPQLEGVQDDALFRLNYRSRGCYDRWVQAIEERSGLGVDYRKDGGLLLFDDEEMLHLRAKRLEWQTALGLRWSQLDASGVRELVPGVSERYVGGIYFPDEAQVDPRRLSRAVARSAQRSGVIIQEGALAHRVIHRGQTVYGVELPDRKVACDIVVVCAGAWSGQIFGSEVPRKAVAPVRGQMVALRPSRSAFRPFVSTGDAYLVPRKDGRVLVGATLEHCGYNKSPTAQGVHNLMSSALNLLPSLGEANFVESWAGLRPETPDHLPIISQTEIDGLFIATGHYRSGILEAPLTAEILTSLVTRNRPPVIAGLETLEVFNVKRFKGLEEHQGDSSEHG